MVSFSIPKLRRPCVIGRRICRPGSLLYAPGVTLSLPDLGAGETEGISLAREFPGSLLLMDERKGANAASKLGILTVGTLAILEEADKKSLIIFDQMITRLRATNFRVAEEVIQQFSQRVHERKQQN